MLKNLFLWLLIAVVLIVTFNNLDQKVQDKSEHVTYSELLNRVKQREVRSITIQNQVIQGQLQNDQSFTSYMPIPDPSLLPELVKNGVDVKGEPPRKETFLMRLLINWFPMLLLIGVWIFVMRQMGGGSRGGLSFSRNRARLLNEDQSKITFQDVAGIEEAKSEISELVDFLKDPKKFERLGAKIPRGVLLMGPPGTGKTLLARAVAGEAKVPFFTISGSDFVEMFVGVGASRVREMFEAAKKKAPAIIFIDELDAVGRHRGAGVGGGHDEREQTLNQLLVEMDGFESNEGVIVMAATNRPPNVLDPALLRPGRFDRQVVVGLPDLLGRDQILQVHLKKITLAPDINSKQIAAGTPGFSGADLANLLNEAALFAAIANKAMVDMNDIEKAKDKIRMGPKRRSMVMSDKERKLTAYHEAGHAIVGYLAPEHDPVRKVTIVPSGMALGWTLFYPEEDLYHLTKLKLEGQVTSLFGGRAAEYIIFGSEQITTGASNDIQRATEIVRNMVTKWGLSPALGPLNYHKESEEVFLGRQGGRSSELSNDTMHLVEQEVRAFIERLYEKALHVLKERIKELHIMAEALLKYETIDQEQIEDIMQGRTPREPREWQEATNNLPAQGDKVGAATPGAIPPASKPKKKASRGVPPPVSGEGQTA